MQIDGGILSNIAHKRFKLRNYPIYNSICNDRPPQVWNMNDLPRVTVFMKVIDLFWTEVRRRGAF